MSQVLITTSKMDALANAVAAKASVSLPLTIDQMTTTITNLTLSGNLNLQDKTVTPTKSQQVITVDSGYDALGDVTVEAISSQYVDTSDATVTAGDVRSSKTVYINNVKTTGTLAIATYYTGSTTPSTATGSDGDFYFYTGS